MGNKKSGLKVLAVILLIAAFIFIGLGVLIQYNVINLGDTHYEEQNLDDEDIVLEEELNVDDEQVIELLTLIKGKDNLERHKYLAEYLDSYYYKVTDEISIDKIDNDNLLKILWFNLKDSSKKTDIEGGFTVSVDEFKKKFESIFGSKLEFSKNTTSTSADACLKVNYNTSNDNYEFYNTCKSDSSIEIIPRVIKVVKVDDELKIYEKVAFYNNKTLYSDIDLRNVVVKDYDDEDIDKYLSSFDTYVYTFELDDNNYYFSKIGLEK